MRAYKVIDGEKVYGQYSSIAQMSTKTKAPVITSRVSGDKVKLTWKKVSGANGYEIYMKTSSKGSYKKIKALTANKTTFTKKGLVKDKKYSFRIRTYKNVGNKKNIF